MAGAISISPKHQFTSSTGVPLVSGTVETYLAGTTTPVATYQDKNLSTPNATTITLDSRGECDIWLDDTKTYKFVVKNSAGVTQYTVDNIYGPLNTATLGLGSAALGGFYDALSLATYAALRAYTGSHKTAYVSGYLASASPSGIAGYFTRDDSDTTSADNAGTIIVDSSNRRWKRAFTGGVNVQWFGAVADGADSGTAFSGTDNTAAFQAALNYASTNRLSVFIPDGKYRFAHQAISDAGYITCENDYYSIVGQSTNAELLIDEDPTWYDGSVAGRSAVFLFATAATSTGQRDAHDLFEVKDLTVRGRWTHNNAKVGVNGFRVEGFREVVFDGIHAYDIRNKITRCKSNASFVVTNTHAERCARGMWRSLDTDKVICTGNYLKDGDDDGIDFHSHDAYAATYPARTSIIITDNHLEGCEGILALGAKHTVVANNTLKLCHGTIIAVGSGSDPEGNTAPIAIIINGNTIIDPLERYDSGAMTTSNVNQGAIYVSGVARSSASTSSVYPGSYSSGSASFLYPWDASGTSKAWGAMHAGDSYDEGSDTSVYSSPGGHGYVITNNLVMRTLPDDSYADWGMGSFFHGSEGYVNPSITSANYKAHGIILLGDMYDFLVSNNVVTGVPNSGIYFRGNSSGDRKHFGNGIVRGNMIRNVKYGIAKDGTGGAVAVADYDDWDIDIDSNKIDVDPYHKADIRTSPLDGTWQSSSALTYLGIFMRHGKGMTIRNNDIKNCYRAIQGDNTEQTQFVMSGNIVRCNPAATAWNAANVGVGVPDSGGGGIIHLIEDGNPTSTTYDKILNTCVLESSSIPTTGKYVTGHFVRNNAPTTSSSKTTLGWVRQNVGSTHTAATTTTSDWAPLVATTS